MMSWFRRLRNRWRESDLTREFDEELMFHLASRTESNVRRGMPPDEAALEARRHLGNLTRAREDMRDVRVLSWLDGLAGDLRHGVRVFARHPILTGLVVVTLSLGIGANAAIFSVFEAVMLRPLPYPAAERLVLLLDQRRDDRGLTSPTIPELMDVRASSRSLDGVTFFDTRDFQIIGSDEPQRVIGARIEATFLSLLGVRPQLGRTFDEEDLRSGNTAIVLLGNALWRRNFGSDPAVVGRTVNINGSAHEIVGVLPETFSFGYLSSASVDLYVPYPASPEYMSRTGQFANVRRVNALARLAPGVSLETASLELERIAGSMALAHPDLYGPSAPGVEPGFTIAAKPLRDALTQNSRPVLLMLVGAVALVLLIACVNTAQFLLAQAIEREPEVAVRSALGARRGRLIRQFVSEALLLAGAGGLLGLVQALWLMRVLRGLVPRGTALVGQIELDGRVVLFLLAVTILTALACALVPALRFSQPNLATRLDTRGAGRSRGRLRHTFIAIEVAMSVVLLASAGLLLRSLHELQRAQGGFSADRVTIMRIRGIGGGPPLGDMYARYLAQVAQVSGIDAVGLANGVLPGSPSVSFAIVGDGSDQAARTRQQASYQIVSGGYFRALGIPLEAGRLFTDDDAVGRLSVAIVNREMAQRFWRDGNPIGSQIRAGEGPRAATMTIVGVVGNVRPVFQIGDVPQLYVSYRQQSDPNMAFVVRTAPGLDTPIAAIKQAIWSVDSRQAVFGIDRLESLLSEATARQRAIATLIGGFSALALAMSISGIYTVITYLVSRRVKEIAVRRAIGASSGDVMWSLASSTLRWSIAGLAAGVLGAFASSRVLHAAVAGVIPLDATLMAGLTTAYVAVVVLAVAAAARGALRIDPAAALRGD
jgi:putative ABC transport system permease protein